MECLMRNRGEHLEKSKKTTGFVLGFFFVFLSYADTKSNISVLVVKDRLPSQARWPVRVHVIMSMSCVC